jgi:hypothetical protein
MQHNMYQTGFSWQQWVAEHSCIISHASQLRLWKWCMSQVVTFNICTAGVYNPEQHTMVYLLWTKGHLAKDIHKNILPVHGKNCLSHKFLYLWFQKFTQGYMKLEDNDRPGHPLKITTDVAVGQVEEITQTGRRGAIMDTTECSHMLFYSTVISCLHFWKVCARWDSR